MTLRTSRPFASAIRGRRRIVTLLELTDADLRHADHTLQIVNLVEQTRAMLCKDRDSCRSDPRHPAGPKRPR